jgi:Ca2+-binding RTX toxin-like protein
MATELMISTTVTAAVLNALIASADPGTALILENGIHNFDAPLVIARSDVTLKGQSEAGTILHFSFATGTEASDIQVNGGAKVYLGTLADAIKKGQTTIIMNDASSMHAGGSVYFYQPNTVEYLAANGWNNVNLAEAANRPFREYIAEIDHIEDDQVFLKSPVPFAMDAGLAKVFTIDLLKGVALSDFTVNNDLPRASPYEFVNRLPAYDSLSAIQISGTLGGKISNVSILNAASNGMSLSSSTNFIGHNILVDGAVNKGGEGNGYGVVLSEAFNNSFNGLDLLNGRHGFIFSAWNAETGNQVQINSTNRDVNFHGSPDVGNMISVDRAMLDYNSALDSRGSADIWSLVNHGGTNHAYTPIYSENGVAFHYAVGASGADEVRGSAGNDYLNGKGGADHIDGGLGDDFIVGGLKRDAMTGGAGSDTFMLRMGDDLDKITDFTFGVGGDTLIFSGNPVVTSIANLKFTQIGADLGIKYGVNSTVILLNHNMADVQAANFEFDSSGKTYAAAWNGYFVI